MRRIKYGKFLATAALFAACGAAHAASFTAGGYTQNFDGMGTGTTLPTDWTAWSITTGLNSHYQWTTSIPGSDVGGGTSETITSALFDTAITNSTKSARPYNIAHGTSTDRVLATSPTGDDGIALQLSLTNDTGATVNSFNISYDIDKFYDGDKQSSIDSSVPVGEELPGYQLFYSVNGGAWTNVAALNPVSTADGVHPVVPVGTVNNNGVNGPVDYTVTSISNAFVDLSTAWGAGQTLLLRWVDDNAVNISADQIIGLNNVSIAAVPEPGTYALLMAGLGLVGFAARRRRG
ncbi:MAG TPA: PEP-CTERM sorting domain-containing protein [Burkholderiales bacterium]|nr:PEP-CTERM sorting domain-containing protein [Burkholderiales bacterium]